MRFFVGCVTKGGNAESTCPHGYLAYVRVCNDGYVYIECDCPRCEFHYEIPTDRVKCCPVPVEGDVEIWVYVNRNNPVAEMIYDRYKEYLASELGVGVDSLCERVKELDEEDPAKLLTAMCRAEERAFNGVDHDDDIVYEFYSMREEEGI